jgi:hypothetical protein
VKIAVIFDEKGQIRGTVVTAYDQMNVRSSEGTRMYVIEKPEVGQKDAPQYVRDLHANFRVDVLGEPRLVRKRG